MKKSFLTKNQNGFLRDFAELYPDGDGGDGVNRVNATADCSGEEKRALFALHCLTEAEGFISRVLFCTVFLLFFVQLSIQQ